MHNVNTDALKETIAKAEQDPFRATIPVPNGPAADGRHGIRRRTLWPTASGAGWPATR